jgi:glycosyltransferase involved in cell wall biosynthesis
MSYNRNVLVFIDWFYPSFKAGGPITSMSNMISLLSKDINFFIVTGDRDLLDNAPYDDVKLDAWIKKTEYTIIYLSATKRNKIQFNKLFYEINPYAVYINGIFSYDFSIKPLIFLKNHNAKLIVATRGMLGENSLKIKSFKKKIFLFLMNLFYQYKHVVWHLNSRNELQQLEKSIKSIGNKIILPNLPRAGNESLPSHKKLKNKLFLVTICRVLPIKNIHFVLNLLKKVKFKCQYCIVGPLEDLDYYQSCLKITEELPDNVEVTFTGPVKPQEIAIILNESDVFISSSLNENYGHSIVEALGAHKPVLISDQTPWKDLEFHKAGADMPLEKDIFIGQLNKFSEMNHTEYLSYCKGAKLFFDHNMNPNLFKERYIELLIA